MTKLSERLAMKIEPEFLEEIQEQADKKGLKTSSYARMKLKEAV